MFVPPLSYFYPIWKIISFPLSFDCLLLTFWTFPKISYGYYAYTFKFCYIFFFLQFYKNSLTGFFLGNYRRNSARFLHQIIFWQEHLSHFVSSNGHTFPGAVGIRMHLPIWVLPFQEQMNSFVGETRGYCSPDEIQLGQRSAVRPDFWRRRSFRLAGAGISSPFSSFPSWGSSLNPRMGPRMPVLCCRTIKSCCGRIPTTPGGGRLQVDSFQNRWVRLCPPNRN